MIEKQNNWEFVKRFAELIKMLWPVLVLLVLAALGYASLRNDIFFCKQQITESKMQYEQQNNKMELLSDALIRLQVDVKYTREMQDKMYSELQPLLRPIR